MLVFENCALREFVWGPGAAGALRSAVGALRHKHACRAVRALAGVPLTVADILCV